MAQKLNQLIAQIFEMREDEIADSMTMKDLEVWDSLKHMELIVSIEKSFGIELTLDEIVAMLTIKGIKEVLMNKGLEV